MRLVKLAVATEISGTCTFVLAQYQSRRSGVLHAPAPSGLLPERAPSGAAVTLPKSRTRWQPAGRSPARLTAVLSLTFCLYHSICRFHRHQSPVFSRISRAYKDVLGTRHPGRAQATRRARSRRGRSGRAS